MAKEWEARQARLTVFTAEQVHASQEWWQAVFGDEPESEEARPREAIVRLTGQSRGRIVQLASGPGRVDLAFAPLAPAMGVPPIVFGEMKAILAEGVADMEKLLPFIGDANRAAIGGQALRETTSIEQGYQELQSILKSVKVMPTMRELIYRVNWPITIDDQAYNRLGTWSHLKVKATGIAEGGAEVPISENNFVNYEFDVNTMADPVALFTPTQLMAKFHEILRLVNENLELGEVAS